MDIVLEAFDTFLFDPIYATLLPANIPAPSPNATFSSLKEASTPYLSTTWQFQPASEYLSFTPSKYAYMSAWPRDDMRRQFVTLFLITWCVTIANPFSVFAMEHG